MLTIITYTERFNLNKNRNSYVTIGCNQFLATGKLNATGPIEVVEVVKRTGGLIIFKI